MAAALHYALNRIEHLATTLKEGKSVSLKIVEQHIRPGRQSRPATNPTSSFYRRTRAPHYITIHNAWSFWDARALNNYMDSDAAAARPASWHFSVDEKEAINGVPINEVAWHAGDGASGTGNRKSIGIEVCDYAILYRTSSGSLASHGSGHATYAKYLEAEENAARLCAHLIRTVGSLLPFPECVVQHTKWRPASGCPSHIRRRKNGWQDFLNKVSRHLDADECKEIPGPMLRVVAGSFQGINLAEMRMAQVDALGQSWDPFMVFNQVGGSKLYRVIAGTFQSRANAEKAIQNLRQNGIADAFLLEHDPDKTKDLPFPPKDLDPEDPSVPEDHEPEIPGGLLSILRQLYEYLKNLFD